MKIKSIKKCDQKEMTVDIEVEETHTYQMSNGAVVHNTTSKLFGLTEGWHLPSMRYYLRWVQFSKSDPLVEIYKDNGYPTKELISYQNTVIVGFPTTPVITELGMGEKLVTAAEATPEEQYEWLRLGEKYWLRGVDENEEVLEKDTGNQISYCLAGEKNHLITTQSGLQRIESITKSKTLNRLGNLENIVDLYDNGVKDVSKVKLLNGAEIIGTLEHKILTIDSQLNIVWKKIQDIKTGDRVVRRIGDNVWNSKKQKFPTPKLVGADDIKRHINIVTTPKTMTNDFALFLGMLMADGSIGENSISFTTNDKYVSKIFVKLSKKLFNVKPTIRFDKRAKCLFVCNFNSRIVSKWLQQLGISRYHNNNCVPECILKSTKKQVENFIKGYTLDGYATNTGYAAICSTTSENMAKDLAALMWNLGYDASIHFKKGRAYYFTETNKGMGLNQYVVQLGRLDSLNFTKNIGFIENRKNIIIKKKNKNKVYPHKRNAVCSEIFIEYYKNNKKNIEKSENLIGIMKAESENISLSTIKNYFYDMPNDNMKFILSKNLHFTSVKSVEPHGKMPTFDITVENSHEYLANSVVVHNTLKYFPNLVDFKYFSDILKENQSRVKCCSVMPQEDQSSYEYLPEEAVTKAEYENIMQKIKQGMKEDVDKTHVDCAGGACPVDFNK